MSFKRDACRSFKCDACKSFGLRVLEKKNVQEENGHGPCKDTARLELIDTCCTHFSFAHVQFIVQPLFHFLFVLLQNLLFFLIISYILNVVP